MWLWLIVGIILAYEVYRRHEIWASLEINRLAFLDSYVDNTLSELEHALASGDDLMIRSLQQWLFNLEKYQLPKLNNAAFIANNLNKVLYGSTANSTRIMRIATSLAMWNQRQPGAPGHLLWVPEQQDPSKTNYTQAMLHNTVSEVHFLWTPSIVDLGAQLLRHSFEASLLASGFRKTTWASEVPVWERIPSTKTRSGAVPLLCLHGITTQMTPVLRFAREFPDKHIIMPMHPTLMYAWNIEFEKKQMMTTQQYVTTFTRWMVANGIKTVDVIAWSLGGFTRNYIVGVWQDLPPKVKPRIRKEVLIEPMGMPVASLNASTLNLLSISRAYSRVRQVAPQGSRMWSLFLVLYLRYHVHVRLLFTDPINNRLSLGYVKGKPSTNRPETLYLLSGRDVVVPFDVSMRYAAKYLPRAKVQVYPEGEHGLWPYHPKFLETVKGHLN